MVSTERNANIVYSDVVAKLPATMVAEVVAAPEGEILPQLPGTAFVVLSDEEKFYGPFLWEETGEGEGKARLIPAAQRFELTREAAQNRLFEVELEEDLKVRLMTGLDELGVLEPSEEITIKEEAHPVPAARFGKGRSSNGGPPRRRAWRPNLKARSLPPKKRKSGKMCRPARKSGVFRG